MDWEFVDALSCEMMQGCHLLYMKIINYVDFQRGDTEMNGVLEKNH